MYLKIIVASVFWVLSVSVGGIVACGQELPRADGPAGQTIPAGEFTLYYKKASSVLDGQYRNNQATMEEMASFFAGRDAGDTLYITVYCSIEDTYQRNALLAERRGRAFLDYLDRQYNVSERYKIRIENVPEDWAGLRRRVEASQMPFRSEVLEVMDRVGVFDGREKILMDLAGGRPYKYMYKTMFPELRRVTVRVGRNRVMADTEKEGPLQSSGKITWPEKDTCVCPETGQTERYCAGTGASGTLCERTDSAGMSPAGEAVEKQAARKHGLYPSFALKTDLVRWAGVEPGFKIGAFTPNAAIEAFFAGRWSVNASAAYSNWGTLSGGKRLSALASFDVEPRFWLRNDSRFRGVFIGVYGQGGSFDKPDSDVSGKTGTFWGVGLGLGYVQPLARHWYLEFEVRGGYAGDRTDYYDIDAGHYYYDHTQNGNRILPAVRLNLTYRY